ncbi:uncharacterized protein FYW49_003253 [Xenentodon cancila]
MDNVACVMLPVSSARVRRVRTAPAVPRRGSLKMDAVSSIARPVVMLTGSNATSVTTLATPALMKGLTSAPAVTQPRTQAQKWPLHPTGVQHRLGTDCHQSCPDRTYSDDTAMVCAPCEDKHCDICDQSQCYWCEEGFLVFDGECVSHCEEGFFVDEESQECEPCHHNCRSCGGPRYDDCDSCEDGVTLRNGECLEGRQLEACPEGNFRNMHPSPVPPAAKKLHSVMLPPPCFVIVMIVWGIPQGDKCQSCAPECGSCKESPSHCLSCEKHLLLLDHSCMSRCPDGYYANMTECHRCPDYCMECNQDGLCKKCTQYYYLHEDRCVDDCPEGYFASKQGQECARCHADCASCDGLGSDDCDVCHDPKAVRYNGKCLHECPSDAYYDKKTNECRDCDRSCLTCSGPEPSHCLSCDTNRHRDASGHCVWYTECPLNSYVDQNGECQQCHGFCHHCSGPDKEHCLSCSAPRFLLNGTCLEKCPMGYYLDDGASRMCERCHFSCESCVGRHSSECVTCKPGFLKQGRSCVQSCSERAARQGTTKTSGPQPVSSATLPARPAVDPDSDAPNCEACHSSCEGCRGPSRWDCNLCPASQILSDDGRCLTCCGDETQRDDKPIPWECCDCKSSREECIKGVNFVISSADVSHTARLAVTACVLLILSLGGGLFLFLSARSRSLAAMPKTKAGGYEKLDTRESNTSRPTTSSFGEYSDKIIECQVEEDNEDEDDIVYMTKDGTVYRKFRYGLLEEDDIELEYDDESYSFT